MFPISPNELQEFMKLWKRTNPEPLHEEQAKKQAEKILSLVSLVVHNPTKNYEN